MEANLQIMGSVLMVLVYFLYLKQTVKGESTPNPSTWIVWFIVMGLNTFSYFRVVGDDFLKTAIVFVGFLGITSIMLYSLVKGKFVRPKKTDGWLLALSIVIGVVWKLSNNAVLSNILLQTVIAVSFLPTAIGLLKNRLKERHWPWTLAAIAYMFQTLSLLVNFNGNYYQLLLPIVNGILGNGMVPAILVYQRFRYRKSCLRQTIT